jgi:hypothetical protein
MSRKQANHLIKVNFMGIKDKVKKIQKPRAVTTAYKNKK